VVWLLVTLFLYKVLPKQKLNCPALQSQKFKRPFQGSSKRIGKSWSNLASFKTFLNPTNTTINQPSTSSKPKTKPKPSSEHAVFS